MLKGKNIVIGVCGGIAIYKIVDLASKLRKKGANVHIIMTKEATNFVSPLTFQEITGNPVSVSMWEKVTNWNVEHISLATLADLLVIAPATGNIIGKISSGIADDMLSTVVMASTCPKLLVPAMNTNMYLNPITQDNIQKLKNYNYKVMTPDSGNLACGVKGIGRLPKIDKILLEIEKFFSNIKNDYEKMTVLVTAGGTREKIDPVRFITNRSSGKMGYAIANAAKKRGANVILISGITNLEKPKDITFHQVDSALEMEQLVNEYFPKANITIMAAAVSDYRLKNISEHKIKKLDEELILELVKNPDILKNLGEIKKDHQFLVGFAAETQNIKEYAKDKLKRKNLDLIIANNVGQNTTGFDCDTNQLYIYGKDDYYIETPFDKKEILAHTILDIIQNQKEKFNK